MSTKITKGRKRSKGEIQVSKILATMDILSHEEVSWTQCRDKRVLRFDFFIVVPLSKGKTAVIEVDGRQHFELLVGCHFGNNEGELAITKQHDTYKNNFLKERGISLLRISYLELTFAEVLIKQFLLDVAGSSKSIYRFSNQKLYSNPFGNKQGHSCIIM